MLGSPLDQLCEFVDPGACHLHKLPDRIWLFGGPVESAENPEASLRDSFRRQTLVMPPSEASSWLGSLDLPENYDEWWAFSGYSDLLEFERDACYLARATVLFAESPGALAELGALAIDNALVDRLIVVVPTRYFDPANRRSFLNLGPLKRAGDRRHLCVISATEEKNLHSDDVQLVVESVQKWLPPFPRTKVLGTGNPTHRLLLLADLVDLLLVSKAEELIFACRHFEVAYSDDEITQALKLLDFFHLVKIEQRGTEMFYVRRAVSGAPWVDYTSKGKEHFDRSRFKVNCNEWIDTQPRRKSILERAR